MQGEDSSNIIPVILSGGVGSRLWPLSRELYPKQLQQLHSERSLLQDTVERVSTRQFLAPMVICNQEHRFIVAEQIHAIGIDIAAIVLEPVGRNTAPAVAVAATLCSDIIDDAILLVMPSDHVIKQNDTFHRAVATALPAAESGRLVTFGITATGPETGYGYIRQGGKIDTAPGCFDVDSFVEKPDRQTAETYLASGEYFWNGGIFMFSARKYMAELKRLQPEMERLSRRAVETSVADMDFTRLDEKVFASIPANSIDYAVMELTEDAAVVPVDMGWSDVGAWDALWEISEKDSSGNVVSGDVIVHDVENSYIRSEHRLIAAVGLRDTVIVAMDDVVLCANKNNAQDVKALVDQLKQSGRSEYVTHTKVYRPWGWYQSLEVGESYQVKVLNLSPGAKISLQLHHHRSEHWVVVAGTATVTRGEDIFDLEVNQSTYIPVEMKHRLENKKDVDLQIIEVQSGDYLGEDDIERFDDTYGRS